MITPQQLKNLETIIKSFANSTKMSDNELWKRTFYGVVEVGSAAPFGKLESSASAQRDLEYEYLLSMAESHNELLRHINALLRRYGVRYAAKDVLKCAKSRAIIENLKFLHEVGGPKRFFDEIGALDSDYAKAKKVTSSLAYIGPSRSRDVLIEIGAAKHLIVIDTRIINILKALGIELPENCTSRGRLYREVELLILGEVCAPLGITGARFDRTLFQNYKEILETIDQNMRGWRYYGNRGLSP